jgi:hypothetical protein
LDNKQADVLLGISRNMEKSLKNIASSLESSNNGGVKSNGVLSSISIGVNALASATTKFNSKNSAAIVRFANDISKVAKGIDIKSADAFGNFMTGLADGLDAIIEIMSPRKLLKLVIGTKVLFGGKNSIIKSIVTGMTDAFKDADPKKAKQGAEAIEVLAGGLMSLSKAMGTLALIGLVAPLVAIGALVARAVIGLFTSVGKSAKEIDKGGKAIGSLGKGLMLFSAGLATFMLVILIVKPAMVLAGIVVLAAFALAFTIIGQVSRYIDDGGKAIAWMGLGLFAFSAALATYMLVLLLVTPKLILTGIAILGLMAGAFALIGYLDKSGFIKSGAKALMVMGESLFVFSIGLAAFSLAMRLVDMQTAVGGPLVITALGGAFWVIGALNKGNFIQSGATAMIEVGIALISISAGILIFGLAIKGLQAVFGDDLGEAGMIAGAILLGLGGAFALLGIPAIGIAIASGAGAMISVGFALMSISAGILIFGLAIKGLQSIFGDDLIEAGVIAGAILLGLGMAFAAIGVLAVAVIPGAAAGIVMGVALLSLSLGVWTFGNTLKGLYDKDLIDEQGNLRGISILSGLMSEFASMFFTSVFALPGIAASIAMGISLMIISKGLSDIGKVMKTIDPSFVDKLFNEQDGILYKLAYGFESIGNKFSGGLISNWLGADPVSMGVKTVKGFGDVLQSVAGGIVAFANFSKFPIKIANNGKLEYTNVNLWDEVAKMKENLIGDGDGSNGLLYSLSSIFSDIGKRFGGESGWFAGDSPVKKGINAVNGMGKVLSELAGGIVAFARFDKFPVQLADSGGKLIYENINLWDQIPKIKTALIGDGSLSGKLTSKSGILFSLAEIFGQIGNKFPDGFISDSSVKQGIDAVSGIGGVISKLAAGIMAFANIERGMPNYSIDPKTGKLVFNGTYTPINLKKIQSNITKIVTSLPAVFASVNLDDIDIAKKKAKSAISLAEAISKIGEAIQKFKIEKGNEKQGMIAMLGPSLKSFVDATRDFELDSDKIKMLTQLGGALQKFADIGDSLSSFAKGLNALGPALSSFSSGFMKFSTQTDKFSAFEKSFSKLVRNQYIYKFDKFADSVGVLKKNVNEFNIEKLKLTDSLMQSLAILSKSPDALGKTISESMDKSFKELIKAIQELVSASNSSKNNSNIVTESVIAQPTTTVKTATISNDSQKAPNISQAALTKLLAEISAALSSLPEDMASALPTKDGKLRITNG